MGDIRQVGNFGHSGGTRVLHAAREQLLRAIAYYVAEETRAQIEGLDADELVVAVDMLAVLAEHYNISPEVSDATVRRWRDTYLPVFDSFHDLDPSAQETSGWPYERRKVIVDTFARLEAVARLRPPFWERIARETD